MMSAILQFMSISRNPRRFAPRRTGDATPLGQLERMVMQAVWRSAGRTVSVGDVHESLAQEPPTAYTTIKTTMERLAEKGILVQEKAGRAYLYRAVLSEADLERRIVTATLDQLVEQFPQAVASFFVRPDPTLTPDQIGLLQEAIERRRKAAQEEDGSAGGDNGDA